MSELRDRVLSVYNVEFPDRKTKRKAMTILKGHQRYPCGAPTMGFLIVDGKEYPACAEMMEVFGINAERRPSHTRLSSRSRLQTARARR